ncbi:MAG: phosphate acetyltransferase [Bacilli bacterium]|nr:phosphate acetyltransferase [Bacilli bacterium]
MEDIIKIIKKRAKKNIKTIVLPETMDRRVLEATDKILKENIAKIILIGNEEEIRKNSKGLDIKKATIINPNTSELTEKMIQSLYKLRKHKGLTIEESKELILNNYMYYACMLVKMGIADGAVSGACHSSSNTLRPALQILKTSPNTKLVSAFFLMTVPNCKYGYKGTFIFADSGLVQNPNPEELASIAGTSAKTFKLLTGETPKIAMLSHSTKGSAKHPDVDKVIKATKIAKKMFPNYEIDGELQLDAAIVPSVAKTKVGNTNVAGHANVLVFPDLDAGNIGYKLVQRLANANAYGPITQGIAKPINDLSRGCTSDDIVGVVAITSIQATKE